MEFKSWVNIYYWQFIDITHYSQHQYLLKITKYYTI